MANVNVRLRKASCNCKFDNFTDAVTHVHWPVDTFNPPLIARTPRSLYALTLNRIAVDLYLNVSKEGVQAISEMPLDIAKDVVKKCCGFFRYNDLQLFWEHPVLQPLMLQIIKEFEDERTHK